MSTLAKPSLQLLRDVDAAFGSFLVDNNSVLLDRDAPARLESEVLNRLGRRVSHSLASARIQIPEADQLTLRFAQGVIMARLCRHGTIILMGDRTFSEATAGVALAVCASQLDRIETITALEPTAVAADPQAAPAQAEPKDRKKKSKNIWA